MSKLKSLRIEKKLTQQQVADLMGISLRSYKSYENDEEKIGTLKYNYIIEKLAEINPNLPKILPPTVARFRNCTPTMLLTLSLTAPFV